MESENSQSTKSNQYLSIRTSKYESIYYCITSSSSKSCLIEKGEGESSNVESSNWIQSVKQTFNE